MADKKITISPGSWQLMRHLWDEAPLTITQLTARLSEEKGWKKATVISTLKRLEEKGAVRWEQLPDERARRYYPAIAERDAVAQETESFLHRVYHGRLGLMVNAMAETDSLSPDDIAELQQILERIK